jgi:hypothetical protein
MSIAEIIPPVRALSRGEKFQLAQMLIEDLATEDLPAMFKGGQVYPIYTRSTPPVPRRSWLSFSRRKGLAHECCRIVSILPIGGRSDGLAESHIQSKVG